MIIKEEEEEEEEKEKKPFDGTRTKQLTFANFV
jgi:hypothetical protein